MQALSALLKEKKIMIETEMERLVPEARYLPSLFSDAMRYSLMANGKRIRPILCLLSGELFGVVSEKMLRCACALEYLHTYTLIHDDLPAMDNDDERRGKPTLHKVVPEGIAILAGDALLTEVFFIVASNTLDHPARGLRVIAELSDYTGARGVVGGQVLDLLSEQKTVNAEQLQAIHSNKTAKLFVASVRMGAILNGAGESDLQGLTCYAENIGLAFQIADDILDEVGDEKKMGKKLRKDQSLHKATYPHLFGLAEAQKQLSQKIENAIDALECFGENAWALRDLARYLSSREN
jgi:geranylgeranyl diphosphate synthase type II